MRAAPSRPLFRSYRSVLRRLHRCRCRGSHAHRSGHVRFEQGPRGGRIGFDLCRTRLLRPLGSAKFALLRKYPQRPSGADAAGSAYRDRPDGTGLVGGAGVCDRRTDQSALRFLLPCTGDGELQEGPIWEARDVRRLKSTWTTSACWWTRTTASSTLPTAWSSRCRIWSRCSRRSDGRSHSVDATQYDGVYAALDQFKYGPRNGKPTAIICHTTKGLRRFFRFHEQPQGGGRRQL